MFIYLCLVVCEVSAGGIERVWPLTVKRPHTAATSLKYTIITLFSIELRFCFDMIILEMH